MTAAFLHAENPVQSNFLKKGFAEQSAIFNPRMNRFEQQPRFLRNYKAAAGQLRHLHFGFISEPVARIVTIYYTLDDLCRHRLRAPFRPPLNGIDSWMIGAKPDKFASERLIESRFWLTSLDRATSREPRKTMPMLVFLFFRRLFTGSY